MLWGVSFAEARELAMMALVRGSSVRLLLLLLLLPEVMVGRRREW